MRTKWLVLSYGVCVMFVMGVPCVGAATGPASVYKVTVVKFELFNGTSFITAFDGASVVLDIAAVDSGQAAGTFFQGLKIPDGSYTQVRATVSDTFTISGRVGTSYTTATKSNSGCAITTVAANEAECVVDVQGGVGTPDPDILETTLTIVNGVPSHSIRVNFNVDNAIQDGGPSGELYPGMPDVTMAMTAL